MEREGSGIKKMRDSYLDAPNFTQGKEPKFYSDRSQFVVTLPNMNYGVIEEGVFSAVQDKEQDREQDKEQDREQDQIGSKSLVQVIQYCKYPKSRAELQEYCGLKGRRNFGQNYLTPLIEKGVDIFFQ